MTTQILVEKADGTLEPYDETKLRHSLSRSGASKEDIEYVATHIRKELAPGIKTSTIYTHAFEELKRINKVSAARYSLRQALAALGPTGFPFEHFLAELLKKDGYEVEVGVELQGKCATHEVDLVAKKEGSMIVSEVKFHNQSRIKSDLKVALYVYARFQDLEDSSFDGYKDEGVIPECWLVTNTKFTKNAIAYATCRKFNLIGWDYPKNGNLAERIERANLQPITVLTTLSGQQKKSLIDHGVVLCKSVRDKSHVLEKQGLSAQEIEEVVEEASGVCHL